VRNEKKTRDAFLDEMVALLPRLWRFAMSQSRQKILAEDLVQQTCERALERRPQFTPGTRLDHWMFAILASVWKNHLRAEKVRRGLGTVDATDLWDESQIGQADEAILKSQLMAAVTALPEWQRNPVFLVYIEQLSYQDAADVLDIPLGTVMSRLAAAKMALAALLNPAAPRLPQDRSYHD
jgi:RNA polymerase sigma-70 factor, ECF subfamily